VGLGVDFPAGSAVSPAFIEGYSWPGDEELVVTATVDGNNEPVFILGPKSFFLDVPLREDGTPTPVTGARGT
jgi:hypothetical protein